MSSLLNDGFFVITTLDSETAGLGDGTKTDGNGFVQKTSVSGHVKIPPYI